MWVGVFGSIYLSIWQLFGDEFRGYDMYFEVLMCATQGASWVLQYCRTFFLLPTGLAPGDCCVFKLRTDLGAVVIFTSRDCHGFRSLASDLFWKL